MGEDVARGTSGVTYNSFRTYSLFHNNCPMHWFFSLLYTEELQDQTGTDKYSKMKKLFLMSYGFTCLKISFVPIAF